MPVPTVFLVVSISIHAPAKGATISATDLYTFAIISIHAPAKGATEVAEKYLHKGTFQSTLPRRERPPYSNR